MPGIAGIISKMSREKNEGDLRLMVDCMKHEPFYTSGTYVNDQLGLYAGWVCHKGSFSDCMPVVNERRDVVLLFSGENFADKEVTDELKRRGHEFDCSNASYLVHLYEEDEEGFLERLNGWFSGVLVDLRKAKLVLFNDRYGMGRVNYYEGKDDLIFSSEAKSLLRIRPELRKVDLESLGHFFACDCVMQDRTLFSDVFLLPAGSAWTFQNGSCVKKDYYSKPNIWEDQPVLEKEIFYDRLRETFLKILPRYFCGNRPIAMSLTSGLDTRAIMSNLGIAAGRFPCYTFTGMMGDILDAKIARRVAESCHQTHSIIRLDAKFLREFPDLAEKTVFISDGCLDASGTYEIYFNKIARAIAPIRMTGKFGSEILGNMSMLRKTVKFADNFLHPDFRKYVDQAVRTFWEIKKCHKISFSVFKETPWYQYGRLAIEMSKLTVRTPYMDNDLVKLMYQAPPDARASKEIRLRLMEDGDPALRKIMTDRGNAGKSNYLFSNVAQLFCYALFKGEYIYLYQLPRWLIKLDYFLAPLHPERLLSGRYQLGHYRLWFRDELSDYVRRILLDKRTASRPYLNKELLGKMVDEHIRGKGNYVNEINKTLTVELIHRTLIED